MWDVDIGEVFSKLHVASKAASNVWSSLDSLRLGPISILSGDSLESCGGGHQHVGRGCWGGGSKLHVASKAASNVWSSLASLRLGPISIAMGLKRSPHQAVKNMHFGEEVIRGDRKDPAHVLQWDYVRLNLPGQVTYDPSLSVGLCEA
jgi:hypothetical protein